MKNLTILVIALLTSFTCLFAESSLVSGGDFSCNGDAWFKYPQNNGSYEEGKDVYVRVDPKKYQDIEYMELYVNGKFIRKESSYPYEWCKGSGNSDSYLRNMHHGTYKLTLKIKDKCGQYYEKFCIFYVKGEGGGQPGGNSCDGDAWFKYPQNSGSFEEGKDVYVRVDPKKYQDIDYMELYVNGKFIRKESSYPYEWCKGSGNSDSYLRNLHAGTYQLKCRIKDKCGQYYEKFCIFYVIGNGGGQPDGNVCDYKVWYKYPQNGKYFNSGSDVYVRLDAENHHNIKYVELYVNDKFVRNETNYPYEWCKDNGNNDGYLRNLPSGTYKLKARVFDQCGHYENYYSTFYVKGGENGGGQENNEACKYKSWFKYPKNNGTYRYGSDVYVRVDTEKNQDVQEMHLYVNGRFVRKETSYPYEWCKGDSNTDIYLRNLKRGTYNLKVRVKTKCGKWYEYFCKFYVR